MYVLCITTLGTPVLLCYNLSMRHKNNLNKYIVDAGFNQTTFARYLGVPRKTLVEYCIGRNLPPNHVARKIAEELGADLLAIWPAYHLSQRRNSRVKKSHGEV